MFKHIVSWSRRSWAAAGDQIWWRWCNLSACCAYTRPTYASASSIVCGYGFHSIPLCPTHAVLSRRFNSVLALCLTAKLNRLCFCVRSRIWNSCLTSFLVPGGAQCKRPAKKPSPYSRFTLIYVRLQPNTIKYTATPHYSCGIEDVVIANLFKLRVILRLLYYAW